MILTDREIQIAIEHELVVVSPRPDEAAYSSSSLDLTLAPTVSLFTRPSKGVIVCVDPSTDGYDHEAALGRMTERRDIHPSDGFDFQPDELMLAWTREYISLKPHGRLAARVEGKSSLARLGIAIHLTAPTIHAGFSGQIRLEMVNHSHFPVRLRTGMRICQLIFEQTVGTPVSGYRGRFSDQTASRAG